MNIIKMGGKTYHVSGNNVSVVNGSIIVDGKTVAEGLSGIIKIEWQGDLANLECNNCDIQGHVHGDVKSNNVKIKGNVGGNVKGNNIECENVSGNVSGTFVKCKKTKDPLD